VSYSGNVSIVFNIVWDYLQELPIITWRVIRESLSSYLTITLRRRDPRKIQDRLLKFQRESMLYFTVPHGFSWTPHGLLIGPHGVLMEPSWSP
jgi:hypothetical protein